MKTIAIIGAGPTGIYTFFSLLNTKTPLSITIYEQAAEAGVGMPYSIEDNSKVMLANIASIEIPPVFTTYLDWLRSLSAGHLARFGVDASSLHERQFLPRILLGEYYRAQFLALVAQAKKQGVEVTVHESRQVKDVEVHDDGVRIWADRSPEPEQCDLAVIATGHVWPDEDESTRSFFPSPWSGLMEADIDACRVGIMGTSLSGLDAAMAVVVQHGAFVESEHGEVVFNLEANSDGLEIVLMSRTGIIPEADFYCPIPYEPLSVVTRQAVKNESARGSRGLLDRVFGLMVDELEQADPQWSEEMALRTLNADSFKEAWFAGRQKHDPFRWAQANLDEVERNKRDKRTVAWRYTVLRLHEAVQDIVPHLNEADRKRFDSGLARVFIDNYAAIPSQSIRRLLALREAGLISVLALGESYDRVVEKNKTRIVTGEKEYVFDVFIDARGQKALKTQDLPFPTLRAQIAAVGDDIPDVGEDYTLLAPEIARGRIAFGAIPWLMHDQPFAQGLTVCAQIGAAMAKAAVKPATRTRQRLPVIDE